MSRAEQASAYCSALLGGPDGDDRLSGLYVTAWTVRDKQTRWRRADQPGAIASLLAELDEQANAGDVYMCTTLASREGGADERPKAGECAGLMALWLDLDVSDAGHKDARYPPSVEQARRIIDALRLPPTLIVNSGGGLHVYWVFTEPWLVRDADDPEAERKIMAALVREWQGAARYHAERLGRWKVDSTHDLARLLRPAGTTNRKLTDNPRRVEIVHHDPRATYSPTDFAEYLPDAEILSAYAGASTYSGGTALLDADQQAVLADVNFSAIWARVTSEAYRHIDHTPEWLADILEAEADNGMARAPKSIARTWNSDRPDLKGDQNRYDAALVKLLAAFPFVDSEGLIEALMCRRLRSGATTDKIDPARRVDYIARTVARFRLQVQHAGAVTRAAEERIERMAALSTPSAPEPAEPELNGTAESDFLDYTSELITQPDQATDDEHTAVARDALGIPDDAEPSEPYFSERGAEEADGMLILTSLLLPEAYRQRGVQVWALEYRDYGEAQRGRMLLRLPVDFAWPVNPPARYRPGRPLPTEWFRRDVFDKPIGFRKALERDCLITARSDSPGAEWEACLRALVPLWRRDSTGGDVYSHAHQWLYSYLVEHSCTGVKEEALVTGRPWVRATGDWKSSTPPEILIDLNQLLDHCRRQAGSVVGRSARGLTEYLHLTVRRPRVQDILTGRAVRPEWYQIDSDQFGTEEWRTIIGVVRHGYDASVTKKRLRAVETSGLHVGDQGDEVAM